MYYVCEIIKRTQGYPEDIPLNECSGKSKKSIFFLNEVQKTLKKSIKNNRMNKMLSFVGSQYKRMINLLLYIVIIGRDRHQPMLHQSRIISKGPPSGYASVS